MSCQEECGEVLMAALLINKAFLEASKNKDTISKEDAIKMLRKEMGTKVKKEELEKVFQTLDEDGSGTLDFQEFLALVGSTSLMFNELMKQSC